MQAILIVDDEAMIASALARVFARNSFSVTTASGGVDAVQKLAKQNFDIVLVDLLMADLNGEEVLDWVQKHAPRTKVVIMTAYGDTKICESLKNKGATLILSKPFEDIFKLPELVQNAITQTNPSE